MNTAVDLVMRRFIKAMKEGVDTRKLHSLLNVLPKEDFMAWRDETGQDALHYAILCDNSGAVDYLLKLGYFASPYEPEINHYAHLAARLGFLSVLIVILHYRPDDFTLARQPTISTPCPSRRGSTLSSKSSRRDSQDLTIPAVVGSQVSLTDGTSRRTSLPKGTSISMSGAESISMSVSSERGGDPANSYGQGSSAFTTALTHGASEQWRSQNHRKSSVPDGAMSTVTTVRRESMPLQKADLDLSLIQKRRHSTPPEESSLPSTSDQLSTEQLTPLDIAARARHIDCVKALLDLYVLPTNDKGFKGYLTMAALAHCDSALKLLLQQFQKPSKGGSRSSSTPYPAQALTATTRDDYRAAVEVCLQYAFPDCLDALLDAELVESKLVFKHISFFHVLYSHSYGDCKRQQLSMSRLPRVTELLIQRGYDVTARVPPRTYPLYSLLHGGFNCGDMSSVGEYIITCMKLLMACGADPNYDEVEFESRMFPNRAISGRPAFSSALHCVVMCVGRYHNRASSVHFAEDCFDVLVAFNADIEKVGRIGENSQGAVVRGDVLCQVAYYSVLPGLVRGLLRTCMRFGAQPQRKINGMYAVNVYLDKLCMELTKNPVGTEHERDLALMLSQLCSYMAPWHIRDAQAVFNLQHRQCAGEQHRAFSQKVNEGLDKHAFTVRTLRSLAVWQVWKLCGRQSDRIKMLPVPKEIKVNVIPLVLFQMMW